MRIGYHNLKTDLKRISSAIKVFGNDNFVIVDLIQGTLKSNYSKDKAKEGLGLGLFIGKTLLEKNFASVNCRNSETRSGAEVIIIWKNKELFNI